MTNIEITSVNNDLVKATSKLLQKKYREQEGKFLLEGFKAIEEAFKSGLEIKEIFVLKECSGKYNFLNLPLILTTEPILKKISDTDSAPEAVAVARQKKYSLSNINNAKKVLLLENVKDSGNLGTIFRTAAAFSMDAVILFGDTVDLYNPKCVRSAVGNLWKTPVIQMKNAEDLASAFNGYEFIATLPKSNNTKSLKNYTANLPYIIMFGSEAAGLSEDLTNLATQKVTIEMSDRVESLNLGVSVGIILYEIN